ncbi:hypothetical protein CRG98_005005 [Punica granatum]|uniref:Uncharacterized protein n=1 Tax=Punica granatum TaxID=22663 RepID=A0A2I0L1W4_PUNGR|nr:hypothetical protein CRG98_005005 [Punica granatum]
MGSNVGGVNLKLLIDQENNRVLFAETGKEFVDFIFRILALPAGTITQLINGKEMVGSIGNLYSSIENLNDTYMKSGLKVGTQSAWLRFTESSLTASGHGLNFINYQEILQLKFYLLLHGGYSFYSSLHLQSISSSINADVMAVKFLKASLQSKTVLTDAFLGNKGEVKVN